MVARSGVEAGVMHGQNVCMRKTAEDLNGFNDETERGHGKSWVCIVLLAINHWYSLEQLGSSEPLGTRSLVVQGAVIILVVYKMSKLQAK